MVQKFKAKINLVVTVYSVIAIGVPNLLATGQRTVKNVSLISDKEYIKHSMRVQKEARDKQEENQ